MHSITLDSVVEEIGKALQSGNPQLAEQFLWPALDQRPNLGALWFYGGVILAAQGKHAVALECFLKSQSLEPHPAVWANAAACLRYMNDIPNCRRMLEIGLDHVPDEPHILGNLCGSYVNEGNPWPGIAYGERVKDHPESGAAAKFNLALLHLEAGHYKEGFELYATGHHKHREIRSYDPDPPPLTRELHEELKGKGKRLLVYGEQGLGDELMFATMLADVKRDYDIAFDSHPRLEYLHRNSSWMYSEGNAITIYPTRKTNDKGWSAVCDAKVPIGNLARFYREDVSKFSWPGPWYIAPEKQTAEYRAHLTKIAKGRKIIGLATRGGTMTTARMYRMMPPDVLESLFADDRLFFVSLDYEDVTPMADWIVKKFGPDRFVWHPSIVWHWDYHQTAALIAATDAVVTVTQTVAHLSAAMGHPTYVMAPSRPDWRMGLEGERWIWYPTEKVRLLRQSGESWQPALSRLSELLEAHFLELEAA
jgi:tetratricopeptide (TPR) repeat protein